MYLYFFYVCYVCIYIFMYVCINLCVRVFVCVCIYVSMYLFFLCVCVTQAPNSLTIIITTQSSFLIELKDYSVPLASHEQTYVPLLVLTFKPDVSTYLTFLCSIEDISEPIKYPWKAKS